MNQAAIEIAAILLRFEVERIERQKTAAASQTLAGENAATATDQPQKSTGNGILHPHRAMAKNKK